MEVGGNFCQILELGGDYYYGTECTACGFITW